MVFLLLLFFFLLICRRSLDEGDEGLYFCMSKRVLPDAACPSGALASADGTDPVGSTRAARPSQRGQGLDPPGRGLGCLESRARGHTRLPVTSRRLGKRFPLLGFPFSWI